jgi:3-deoxy-D-manno-octulosonate 8-phosphate phosphatase (KDO 8-P phosphatase)
VDGTLTDGGLYYTDSGEELKKFNVKDGQGLKLVMELGVEVAIVSASTSPSTQHRARKLGITQVHIGVEDKLSTLEALCGHLGLTWSQVAYVGDDVNDLAVMQAVGCPLTVADAMPANQACAIYVTQRCGGEGAVREVCDLIRLSQGQVEFGIPSRSQSEA